MTAKENIFDAMNGLLQLLLLASEKSLNTQRKEEIPDEELHFPHC